MLKTIRLTEKFHNEKDGCVMLLGGFDGLHLGHKRLVKRAKEFDLSIGIMTIAQGKGAHSLFTFEERESIFQNAGIDFVFELPFAEIKDLSPKAFATLLQSEFSPKVFICGDDFRFGKNAAGGAETLKHATQVCVECVKLVTMEGEKISSSFIKECLKSGDVEKANLALGEEFFLMGEVFKDRGIGKALGFPTANILYPKEKFPIKLGVYETRVEIDGKEYRCITNYGARPTFEDHNVLTETYIDGFSGDLYGKRLTVRFVRFLRENQKFESIDALKGQLEKDIGRVRKHD